MEKSKLSVNTVLNLLSFIFIAVIFIALFTPFWEYSGTTASIHDLIGLPKQNEPLQEYLAQNYMGLKDIKKIDFNSFVLGPIALAAGAVVGGIICAVKFQSIYCSIFNFFYGVICILNFSLVKIFTIGTKTKFFIVMGALLVAVSIVQIIFFVIMRKETEFNFNTPRWSAFAIGLLSILLAAACVFGAISNINYSKEAVISKKLDNALKRERGEISLITMMTLKLQIKGGEVNDEGIAKVEDLITRLEDGELEYKNKDKAINYLNMIKSGEVEKKDLNDVLKVLDELDKAEYEAETKAYEESQKEKNKEKTEEKTDDTESKAEGEKTEEKAEGTESAAPAAAASSTAPAAQ